MRIVVIILLLLAARTVSADPLTQLRQSLGAMTASMPVKAKVELTYVQRNADDDAQKVPPATISLNVAADDSGLRMSWPRDLLDAAAREARSTDPEAVRTLTRALSQAMVTNINEYLDASPRLLNALRNATLSGDQTVEWKGKPARLLSFKLDPPMSKQSRKYVKELNAVARIWLDSDGVPLAAEQSVAIKGRAMLVISFESTTNERFEFARNGDRLMVTVHHRDSSNSGGGESGTQSTRAQITAL